MEEERARPFGMSANGLKIIAALSMLVDHIGLMLFPNVTVLRILGRLAYPIFAFMIAEGCHYTRRPLKYLLTVFTVGAACQLVYFFYSGRTDMCILITFSLSIGMILAMQHAKAVWLREGSGAAARALSLVLFFLSVLGTLVLTHYVKVDYGFLGCIVPLFAALLRLPKGVSHPSLERLDRRPYHVLLFGVALLLMSRVIGHVQPYSLLAIPLLLLYSGERGRVRMKYVFYIFYPAHLLLLEGIALLLRA